MKTTILKQSLAITALIICVLTAGAQTKPAAKGQPSIQHNYGNEYLNVSDDSTTNPVQTMVNFKRGHERYDFTLAADKVIELYVNGRQIPADSFYVYNTVITKLKEQIKIDRAQAIEDMKQAEEDRKQAEEDRKQAVKDQAQAEEDRKQAEEERKQSEIDRQGSIKDQQQADEDRKQAVKDRMQADEDRKQAELDRKQAVKDQAQAEEDRKQAEVDRKQAEEDRKMVESLMNDIVAEHIVADRKSIKHVDLDDDEFSVNGKVQSAELLKKFKEKYIKKPGYSFSYGGTTSGYGIHIKND